MSCGSCFHCGEPVLLSECVFLPAAPGREPAPCCLECDAEDYPPPTAELCDDHGVWYWPGRACRGCDRDYAAEFRRKEMMEER